MRVFNGQPVPEDVPDLSPEGRALARSRSAGCGHCGGEGLVIVDARAADARVRSCAATCVCVHGRWLRAWHRVNNAALVDRLVDLEAILTGRDRRWGYDVGEYDPGPVAKAPTRADINDLFRRAT